MLTPCNNPPNTVAAEPAKPLRLNAKTARRMDASAYPSHWVASWLSPRGIRVTLRPIRREDAAIEQAFVIALSPQSRCLRFIGALRELSPETLLRFTQINFERDMAFVAIEGVVGRKTQIGVCRYIAFADGTTCEFAVAIADDWHRCGLGSRMMQQLVDYARTCRLQQMVGDVLTTNIGMLTLCAKLGFSTVDRDDSPAVKRVTLTLTNAQPLRNIHTPALIK